MDDQEIQVVALLSISAAGIAYQWFADGRQIRHEDHLDWADIAAVDVFKRDLFAVDLICVQLLRDGEMPGVEVSEDDPRWSELTSALPVHLPGCQRWGEWFNDVAFPAFAANPRRIYARP